MALELHGWLSRRSEFTKFIIYTTLMLFPLALGASLYTGNWLLPVYLGFFLVFFGARLIIIAVIAMFYYWPFTLTILMILLGYDYLSKNRTKKTGDNRADNQEPAKSSS